MEIARSKPSSARLSWPVTILSLLPIWLMTAAVSAEGFPSPPLTAQAALAFFIAAVLLTLLLAVKRWAPPVLFLYYLLPLVMMMKYDEIFTNFKTPFLFTCALILSLFGLAYLRSQNREVGLYILAAGALVAFVTGNLAGENYWNIVGSGHTGECWNSFCAPPTGEYPWWKVFLHL